jgi:hypothetical protein
MYGSKVLQRADKTLLPTMTVSQSKTSLQPLKFSEIFRCEIQNGEIDTSVPEIVTQQGYRKLFKRVKLSILGPNKVWDPNVDQTILRPVDHNILRKPIFPIRQG